MTLEERVLEAGVEGAVLMTGFDDCAIGIMERFGMEPVVVYDREKVIDKIMKQSDGGTYEDAFEYYEFNQLGAWWGEKTPAFLLRFWEDVHGSEGIREETEATEDASDGEQQGRP